MMSLDSRNAPSLDLPARFMVLAIACALRTRHDIRKEAGAIN